MYFYLLKKIFFWTSLVAQWLRIRLPVQGTRVRALVQEDPTCRGATKPVRHSYWACALEPANHNYWANVPQLLKPACLEPMLLNKRGHCSGRPTHRDEGWPPLTATRESLHAAAKTQRSQKLKKTHIYIYIYIYVFFFLTLIKDDKTHLYMNAYVWVS